MKLSEQIKNLVTEVKALRAENQQLKEKVKVYERNQDDIKTLLDEMQGKPNVEQKQNYD